MTLMTKEYPHLPVLPLEMSIKVFKRADVGPTKVSQQTGISRVSVSNWFNDTTKNPTKASIERVSTLAYKVLRALKHRHLPAKLTRQEAIAMDMLRDRMYPAPLSDTPAQDLLPKAWLDHFSLPREQHEPASVL